MNLLVPVLKMQETFIVNAEEDINHNKIKACAAWMVWYPDLLTNSYLQKAQSLIFRLNRKWIYFKQWTDLSHAGKSFS